MKKFIISALLGATTCNLLAGGYLTNTNQSINFLRNPSRDASIGIDGVYYNPAGVALLGEGWHLQFNWQTVHQHRDTWSDYQMPGLGYDHLFKYNTSNPVTEQSNFTRKSKGRVNVPIQPSLFLAYNKDRWSFQFGFGFIGGGGECEFENGVGSFEYLAAASGMYALSAKGLSMTGYDLETYMKGRSYDLGFTLGAAYKIIGGLSGSIGLRGIYATNNYSGYLRNIQYHTNAGITVPGTDLSLDCDQSGFGIAPIIGLNYKVNDHFNVAAKYEFRTAIEVKSSAHNNDAFNAIAATNAAFSSYLDDAKTRTDLPALLAVGVQYSPIKQLRINAGYHHYFDTDAKQWADIDLCNTNEITAGVEYDLTDRLEVSGGYQKTMYDQPSDFHSDTNFTLDSYSLGIGLGYRLSKKVKLNAAYFQTIYDNYNQEAALSTAVNGQAMQIGTKYVTYSRTNRVIGVGIDIDF